MWVYKGLNLSEVSVGECSYKAVGMRIRYHLVGSERGYHIYACTFYRNACRAARVRAIFGVL